MIHERIYLDKTDQRVYIDTYVANDDKIRPAILIIPGGGYAGVSQFLEGEPIALEFFAKDYNAFVLNYRVGKDQLFPNQLTDAARAMLYIRENAEKLKVKKDRVFAAGCSAGGHLTGALATMYDCAEMREILGDKCESIRPDGVVLCYPVTTGFGPTHRGSFVNLLGKPFEEITEEELRYHSIECNVNEKSSPMFIWHTAEDGTVPVQGSIELGRRLAALGVSFKLSIYPYGPHALGIAKDFPFAECWVEEALMWLETL
jgi:acetyl esterase/lipase